MHTRLPNPQVLLEYLNLYKKYREADRTSTMSTIKWAYEKSKSVVTSQDPVQEQIDRIIVAVESEVRTAKDFADWFNLIFILRRSATEAKALKYKNDESLLHETLHAMAGFIVFDFNSQETTRNLFAQQVEKLKKEYKDTKNIINHCLDDRSGKGVEEQNKKLRDIVLKFSMLGTDRRMLNKARLFKLLDHLKVPEPSEIEEYMCDSSVNHHVPLCIQPRFCEWLYAHRYQKSISPVSFSEFTKNAIERAEKEKLKKEQEDKARLDKLRNAAARINSAQSAPAVPGAAVAKQPVTPVLVQQPRPVVPADDNSRPDNGKAEAEGEEVRSRNTVIFK